MSKITKTLVDAIEPDPSGRRRTIWDVEVKGFGLVVLPTGVKSFVFEYSTPEGRRRRATIGKYGQWTAQKARERAERWRDVVRDGGDPLAAKKALLEAPTVGQILDAYVASQAFAQKADSTKAIDRGRITRHLRPMLGREHVHRLTAERVRRAMADITAGKTKANVKTKPRGKARVGGGAGTARMAIGLLRAILNWAVSEGMIATNPAASIKLGTSGTREAILESAEDYERLFRALEAMEREGRLRGAVADAIRVVALCGARRGEIAGLRWRHVDLERGMITIPPAGHKTGRKTGKPRQIGLAAPVRAIIARRSPGEPDDYVSPPSHGAGPVDLSGPFRDVRAEAKLPASITLHSLRHSLATSLALSGAEAAQLMAVLGHAQMSTTARYLHFAHDAHRALAERAAATALAGLTAASSDDEAGEVVELDKRRPRPK